MHRFNQLMSSLLLLVCCLTSTEIIGDATSTGSESIFQASTISEIGDRVADWQIAHLNDLSYIRNPRGGDFDRRGWQHGALYVGLMNWASLPGKEKYDKVLLQISEENQWRLGDRLFHGDDHVVGQLYLHFYNEQKDQKRIEHTIRQFNQILLADPDGGLEFTGEEIPGVGLSCQLRWCWCDALFMSPPTWIGLSLATGDERYMAYGDREFRATQDYLMDPETSLFFRDSRYLDRLDEEGKKIFWSRGNGWVYAGVVNILRALPEDHPLRAHYIDLYMDMSETIAGLQQDNGLWRVSLLGGEQFSVKETSGSAFMTYGLAWGLNNNYLDTGRFGPVVRKGWKALVEAVQDDGKLGWVQPVGFAPDSVLESDSHLYGVGAFLLAAEQMYRADIMAFGRFVPEREDDFAWENDKVAFRVYGPSSGGKGQVSGVDAWLKRVSYPVIDKWYAEFLAGKSYHEDHGEGYDPYHVGDSRGVGGTAIWIDGQAWPAGKFTSYELLQSGGDIVEFNIQAEWQTPLGLVAETKTVSLALGEQLYQVHSVFTLDGKPAPLPVAIGLTTHDEKAQVFSEPATGRISTWEVIDGVGLGTGVLLAPGRIENILHTPSEEKDKSHIWLITSSNENGELSFSAGFAWQAAQEITTKDAWNEYLDSKSGQ